MSDIRYDVFQHYGTNAERLAFTPNPAVGIQPIYIWFETDTGNTYVYHTAWAQMTGGGTVPGPSQSSFLVSGGQIVWLQDYDFLVSAATYYIQGLQYSSAESGITLDAADATDPRIDVIAVDDTGTVVKITGVPAPNPSEPDINPNSQLKLGIVLVPALSSEPTVSNETVYYDNAGGPGEWNWTTSGTGFDVNSSNNPKSPSTVDIEGTNPTNNAYAQGEIASGTYNPNTADLLILYIRSKATWSTGRSLVVSLRLSGVLVGSAVTIARTGTFGFTSSNTATYQLVAIPVSLFAVPAGTEINQLRITCSSTGSGGIGFYIDDIFFQVAGASQAPGNGITQTEADARYLQRANNLSDVTVAATARTNLGLGSLAVLSAVTEAQLSFSDVTTANATTTQHGLLKKLPNDNAVYLDGTGNYTTPPGTGAGINELTGDVTAGPGDGSQAATLSTTGVTASSYGDATTVPVITVDAKGRLTSVTTASITVAGITQLTSDVTAGPGSGSQAATIASGVVTNTKLADVATATIKGRVTASTGSPEDLTSTQATTLINTFVGDTGSGGIKGLVTVPAAGDAAKFLKGDGTWDTPSTNPGDVTASANIDDHTIVRGDGGTKGIQDSGITIDDTNNVTGVTSLAVGGTLTTNTVTTITGQLQIVPSNHSAAGSTETIDFAVSNEHTVVLDENVTLTFSNPVDGGRYTIILIQDGTGTNTVTWPTTVKWPSGTTPTITATGNHADLVTLYYIASLTVYLASINQDYTVA